MKGRQRHLLCLVLWCSGVDSHLAHDFGRGSSIIGLFHHSYPDLHARPIVFAVRTHLAGNRRRDAKILRQTVFFYCIFLLGWIPIGVTLAMDTQRHVDQVVYSSLHIVASISSLIMVICLTLFNNELKDYLQKKIRLWLRC